MNVEVKGQYGEGTLDLGKSAQLPRSLSNSHRDIRKVVPSGEYERTHQEYDRHANGVYDIC